MYDEGTIEQQDLAYFNLALGPFDHAVAERRANLQSSVIDSRSRPADLLLLL
jgi:hypothetical protein